ncbi:MAG: hypothetical protein H6646_06450 [Anaerolineales bacterium]|nr:hypothetical protein [Anaerolineales bacterium]
MSFGCYNNRDDVNRLLAMLERIARNDYAGDYRLDRQTGEYRPADFTEPIASYFTL